MVRYGIFIEPRGEARDRVIEWKERVEAKMPGQPYCCHPPHSTLLISPLAGDAEWITCLTDMLSRLPSFRINVNDVIVFPDDVLAGGGNTVAYRAEVTGDLLKVQLACAEAMAGYVDHAVEPPPLADREPFKSSFEKYGFPFVGEHWIPHFSVASIQSPIDCELITEFMAQEPRFGFDVTELVIWRVEGDDHTTEAVIELS